MAIALVGAMGAYQTVSVATITPAFGQATTAGNLLVAWLSGNGTATITVSGSGWTSGIQAHGTFDTAAIFYKPNCGAGETAPTFTLTAATKFNGRVAEFSGANTVSPLEKTGTTVVNASPTSPQVVNASAADAASGNLVLATAHIRDTATDTTTLTDTLNNGATATNHQDDGATTTNRHESSASYGITTSNASADQDSLTFSSAATSVVQVIASFQVPAAAGGVPRIAYGYGSN